MSALNFESVWTLRAEVQPCNFAALNNFQSRLPKGNPNAALYLLAPGVS